MLLWRRLSVPWIEVSKYSCLGHDGTQKGILGVHSTSFRTTYELWMREKTSTINFKLISLERSYWRTWQTTPQARESLGWHTEFV